MKTSPIFLSCLVLLLITISAPASFSQEQDPSGVAADLAEQAAELYNNGDAQGAIELFVEAMSYVRDPAFAFNLAFIYDELEVLPQAWRYYGLYLELYPGAPNRGDVEERLGAIEESFQTDYAQLSVSSSVSSVPVSAEVLVSSGGRTDSYGETPLDSFVLPGAVDITIALPGHDSVSRSLNAVAGVRLEVDVELERVDVVTPINGMRIAGWSLVGVGGVLSIIGAVYWGMSNGSVSDYEDRLLTAGPEMEDAEVRLGADSPELTRISTDLQNEINGYRQDALDEAKLGNVLFLTGVSVIVGGAVLLVIDAVSEPDGEHTAFDVLLFDEGAGFGWSTRF